MKRHLPDEIYRGAPCSVVAVGCALGIADSDALRGLYSDSLRRDGYLSLDGMNRLVRANMAVVRRTNFKRGERPLLRDWAHANIGKRAVICVAGHFIYFDGRDYYSFFKNGGDEVISVWEVA